jgi:hypothetical protein
VAREITANYVHLPSAVKALVIRFVLAVTTVALGQYAMAAKHPVPLEPKTDSAKCLECHEDKGKGTVVHSAIATGCTSCHNSENNREFGGTGPNGPHGSANSHILERRYDPSQVTPGTFPNGGPGTLIVNLAPTPPLEPTVPGPYALCAKCHDLNNIVSDNSFKKHGIHINKGFSCSVCHSAHGVPSGTTGIDGKRLVNFDVSVVAPFSGTLSYSGGTCTLTCHMMDHKPDGTVTPRP